MHLNIIRNVANNPYDVSSQCSGGVADFGHAHRIVVFLSAFIFFMEHEGEFPFVHPLLVSQFFHWNWNTILSVVR